MSLHDFNIFFTFCKRSHKFCLSLLSFRLNCNISCIIIACTIRVHALNIISTYLTIELRVNSERDFVLGSEFVREELDADDDRGRHPGNLQLALETRSWKGQEDQGLRLCSFHEPVASWGSIENVGRNWNWWFRGGNHMGQACQQSCIQGSEGFGKAALLPWWKPWERYMHLGCVGI